jgi:hypothetical protein
MIERYFRLPYSGLQPGVKAAPRISPAIAEKLREVKSGQFSGTFAGLRFNFRRLLG